MNKIGHLMKKVKYIYLFMLVATVSNCLFDNDKNVPSINKFSGKWDIVSALVISYDTAKNAIVNSSWTTIDKICSTATCEWYYNFSNDTIKIFESALNRGGFNNKTYRFTVRENTLDLYWYNYITKEENLAIQLDYSFISEDSLKINNSKYYGEYYDGPIPQSNSRRTFSIINKSNTFVMVRNK